MSMKKIPLRSEVLKENTWATEDIFEDDAAWEKAFEEAQSYPAKIASFAGKISASAEGLLEYLTFDEEADIVLTKLYSYAHLNSDTDTGNANYQAMVGRSYSFFVQCGAASAFATPELIGIDDETMERFYKEEPRLELYRRYLDRIRKKRPHVLSESEEKLLAGASEISGAANTIGSFFRNADLRFPDIVDGEGNTRQLTQGSYIPCVESSDRVLRKNAFDALYHTFGSFKNTTAALLDAQMRQLKFFASSRKYGSALEASLARTEVPTEVYHNLIATVHKNMPLMHRYMALRKKLMKLDELHMYDIYPTLVSEAENVIPFEEAKKITLEALKPLGEDYLKVVKHAYENRWIDVYENVGKRGGAYSSGARPHPYVLLNHEDTLNSMFTLAHEMGHAMHSYLSKETQPTVYADYVIFVAEVASTCNEALLMSHLLSKTTDKAGRAYLINYFLEQFRTTLYRQTMFAEFELEMSKLVEGGQSLTADTLCKIYHRLNEEYYGPAVTIDPEIDMEWARIPHFFMNFYVFQYATGFSAAMALSRKILNEGDEAVKKYLGFLSAGCSDTPIEILKKAGVDMATAEPIETALKTFEELLDEFEELMA
ncbi:MAG: oligoendopeptidase F [Clostridia bacterium]|nr:oligoendopeptidase F [Clostridia bacterium]